MKNVRLWLLVLLAMLLPLRGAVAAAMPCAGEPAHHHHASHPMAAVGGHAPAATGGLSSHHGHRHVGADRCKLCASCCSATPLLATFSLSVATPDEPSPTFAAFQARAPSFVSEAQERPPRSF